MLLVSLNYNHDSFDLYLTMNLILHFYTPTHSHTGNYRLSRGDYLLLSFSLPFTYLLIFQELLRHWQISHEEVTRGNAYESHSRFDEAYHRFFYRGCCHVSRETMLDEVKAMCKYLFCLFSFFKYWKLVHDLCFVKWPYAFKGGQVERSKLTN